MPKAVVAVILLFVGAIVAASIATGMFFLLGSNRAASIGGPVPVQSDADSIIPGQPRDVLESMRILPFQLFDQNGNPVDQHMFDGKVSIIDFFFTRCPGPCPAMTSEMRRIQQELAGTRIQFISFSVDAAHDGPSVLRGYAESYGADLSNWTFVTGDPDQIAAMVTDGLGYALDRDTTNQVTLSDGSKGDNILHPTHLVLVGPDRSILALAAVGNHEHVNLLVQGARRLVE